MPGARGGRRSRPEIESENLFEGDVPALKIRIRSKDSCGNGPSSATSDAHDIGPDRIPLVAVKIEARHAFVVARPVFDRCYRGTSWWCWPVVSRLITPPAS